MKESEETSSAVDRMLMLPRGGSGTPRGFKRHLKRSPATVGLTGQEEGGSPEPAAGGCVMKSKWGT